MRKLWKMARPGRFERPTSGSGDQRSIQLSYGRAVDKKQFSSVRPFAQSHAFWI